MTWNQLRPWVRHKFNIFVPARAVEHTWEMIWLNRIIKIEYTSPLRRRHLRRSK